MATQKYKEQPPNFRLAVGSIAIKGNLLHWCKQHGHPPIPLPLPILVCLRRHMSGDWGELGKEDWKLNNDSVNHDKTWRVLSKYSVTVGNDTDSDSDDIYIITEWNVLDPHVDDMGNKTFRRTTIFFCRDY